MKSLSLDMTHEGKKFPEGVVIFYGPATLYKNATGTTVNGSLGLSVRYWQNAPELDFLVQGEVVWRDYCIPCHNKLNYHFSPSRVFSLVERDMKRCLMVGEQSGEDPTIVRIFGKEVSLGRIEPAEKGFRNVTGVLEEAIQAYARGIILGNMSGVTKSGKGRKLLNIVRAGPPTEDPFSLQHQEALVELVRTLTGSEGQSSKE